MSSTTKRQQRKERIVAAVLLLCLGVVAFWEVMSRWSQRPFSPFAMTAETFEDFRLDAPGWDTEHVPVRASPTEPNIMAYRLQKEADGSGDRQVRGRPVLVRLVHGFNMVDCMRIKGYTVDLIEDRRQKHAATPPARRFQLWRLTSSVGDVSIWATSILRAGDMSETGQDVRSMSFPNIATPEDPNWAPQGLTWESLRHPIRSFKRLVIHKWNGARQDLLTFLRLRRPSWASDEKLTLVSAYRAGPVAPPEEDEVAATVLNAHYAFLRSIQAWWRSRPEFEAVSAVSGIGE